MRFNPNVSIALGLDDEWSLQSFPVHESVLHDWPDKPWSAHHFPTPHALRIADERIDPLQHINTNDAQGTQQPAQEAGPFLHEAPQSIQDLFAAFLEEDLIEGEELSEEITLRSWYVHHRRVPEWNVPRDLQLHGHWRFWAADVLSAWNDQVVQDEDVALALVFPNPPRNNVFEPILFDVLVMQGLDLPRRACLATVIRHHDPQQRAERSLAISLPHLVSAKYIAARAHLTQDCHLHDCTVRHGRQYLEWNDRPLHDARDGQSFVIRRLSAHAVASAAQAGVNPGSVDDPNPLEDEPVLGGDDAAVDDGDAESEASLASTVDRQAVYVHRLGHPTSFGHADWSSHNAAIASVARIAEVPILDVVTIHPLQCVLPDQPAEVRAVILHHVRDIQPASTECLVVVDLELHAHPILRVPPVRPHVTRQVHRVYPFLYRRSLLQLTGVDAYCEWMNDRCLVLHNGRGWPILERAPRRVQHGACFKVIVPPPPDPECDTAYAVRVAQEAAELFDFPMAGNLASDIIAANDPADRVLAPRAPPSSQTRLQQHRNGEDHEFDDFPVSEPSRRPAPLDLPDVDWSGQWIQQLVYLMQAEGSEEVIEGPTYLYLQTWFVHHESHVWCRHPRPVRLTNEIISWSYDLRQTWNDLLDPNRAVRFHVVQLSPQQGPWQSYAGHVLLEQAPAPGRAAIVVSAILESSQRSALMQFAKSFPRFVTSADAIQEAELNPQCTVRPCSVWIGPRQLNVAVATELLSGQGMRIHVKPMPYSAPATVPPPMDIDTADGVSLMQATSSPAMCPARQCHSDHAIRQVIQECCS